MSLVGAEANLTYDVRHLLRAMRCAGQQEEAEVRPRATFRRGTVRPTQPPCQAHSPVDRGRLDDLTARLAAEIVGQQWRPRGALRSRLDAALLRERMPGLYPSYTQLSHFFLQHYIDRPVVQRFDRAFRIPDNNMFVSTTVTQCLLDAAAEGVEAITEGQLLLSLQAILEHRDRNSPAGVPGYGFYRQRNVDGRWVQWPDNMARATRYLSLWVPWLYRTLRFLGVDSSQFLMLSSPDVVEFIVDGNPGPMLNRLNMPPDLDDTGLALGLGGTLLDASDRMGDAAKLWQEHNHDVGPIVERATTYAYRPFSPHKGLNIIDPRTYYWMRAFLHQRRGTPLALWTTWMQEPYQDEALGAHYSKVPLRMNNVEPTVCGNFLWGVNRLLLAGQTSPAWFTDDFAQAYRDTGDLLCWVVDHDALHEAADVALLYYPTPMSFYWSLSRNLQLLENAASGRDLRPLELERLRDLLATSLRGPGTEQLLGLAERAEDGGRYWHGVFSGGDDCVYATALALNALLDIWSLGAGPSRRWLQDTPSQVRHAVQAGVAWLLCETSQAEFPWRNACFSGSVKGYATLPFHFPMNARELHGPNEVIIRGVRGLWPEDDYLRALEECRQRLRSGVLGKRSEHFTYWTSATVSKAVVLLALAKYANLVPADG